MEPDKYYKIIEEGKPKLQFCEIFDDNSSIWNYSRHSHPYIELMYFLEGKGKLEISGRELSISLYDVVVYPTRWMHQEDAATEKRRKVICLWVELPELQLESPIQLHDEDNVLGNLFRLIAREAKREKPEPLLLEYEIKTLLTMLLRNQSEIREREGALGYVLQYIHTNYAERITLEQLAELEHISKSYLSRQFKKQTGMTVVAYVNQLRIETAKRLLITSRLTVNEVAYRVGFESPKYFYRTFKTLIGESPAAFRRTYTNQVLHSTVGTSL